MNTIKTIIAVAFVATFALSFQSCSSMQSIGSNINDALGGDTGYFTSELDFNHPKYVKKTFKGSDGGYYSVTSVVYPKKKAMTAEELLERKPVQCNLDFASFNR